MRLATTGLLMSVMCACQAAQMPPSSIDLLVPQILQQDNIPSAVIIAGDLDHVSYARAFGDARLDTIYDLASCTKVVATATAVMKLVEEGKLALDDPIGKYLKPFEGRHITLRECLHHCSGLPAYLTPRSRSSDGILTEIASLRTGTGYVYSCLNFVSLARVVENVTRMPLADYLHATVFGPLGMNDTGFAPPASRCAPTAPELRGVVHDPLARAYATAEHQSGNAGLFSTGGDLAIFCRALLQGRILKPETVARMFEPDENMRGLGWDVFHDPPYRPGVGHTGFTGTLIWMEPATGRFAIVLSNRVLSGEQTNVARLRKEVLAALHTRAGHGQ
ncbi:MAG TPA: serine hydrolase domain-containing protein [Planctomycetota bacterium]|nr:serine hydrolase domain-containing protein [Planctomycetota bacterium]